MSLKFFGDADSGFTLYDDDDFRIGWIDGRALGFRCFADLATAASGAGVAYSALAAWAKRLGGPQPLPEIGEEELQIVHDGAYMWFASGQIPVARVLMPHTDFPDDRGHYGIEFVLPRGIGPVAAIAGAQAIHAALERALPGSAACRVSEPVSSG